MVAGMVPEAGLRRARQLIPAGVPRRVELIAAGGTVIVLAHLVLAPLTLVVALAFAAVSKVSRWRLWWLLAPAAAGLIWVLAAGPAQALAGFAAGPSAALRDLGRAGHAWHPLGALDAERGLLAGQLPVALIGGAAEAALIGWLDWLHTDEWAVPPPRPGLVAAARRALAARGIRAGAVLTRDGCALGVVPSSGAVAELRWAESVHGTLIIGASAQPVAVAGLQLVHAALRRRKPVIVLDPGGDGAIARAVAAACEATGTPLLASGPPAAVGREAVDLGRVISERSAMLVPVDGAEMAARVCASLQSLARDLGRIGVDGDALVWAPPGELLPAQALGPLLRDAATARLSIVIGTTSPAAAAELAALAGTVLVHRVADRELAATLAARAGLRLPPAPGVAVPSVPRAEAGEPADAGLRLGSGPQALLNLGQQEFVLAVSSPRRRLIALGRLVPARLPSSAPRPQEDGPVAHRDGWEVPGDGYGQAGRTT